MDDSSSAADGKLMNSLNHYTSSTVSLMSNTTTCTANTSSASYLSLPLSCVDDAPNMVELRDREITEDAASMCFSSNEDFSDFDGFCISPQNTPSPPSPFLAPLCHCNDEEKETEQREEAKAEHVAVAAAAEESEADDRCLVFFDWDDTLHPTSAIHSTGGGGGSVDMGLLRKFSLSVYETLLVMIRLYGSDNIYIVSNADKQWIEKCLSQLSGGYFINIYHLISLYNIRIISAKNDFSSQFPKDHFGSRMKWKQLSFEHLVKRHHARYTQKSETQTRKPFSVVCIGDSQHEYVASKRVIERLNADMHMEQEQTQTQTKIVLHRIKLLSNPSVLQLIEQYSLLQQIACLFKSEVVEIDIDYQREMQHFASASAATSSI